MEVIFTFRLTSGTASEHTRARCGSVRWRRREVAKQEKKLDRRWKVGEREAVEANEGKRGNNETIK